MAKQIVEWAMMLSTVLTLSLGFITQGNAADIPADEARQIAAEAYVYTYPLVLMDITRLQMTNVEAGVKPGGGPMNTFSHFRSYPDAEFREVVRPNFDTLYSITWLDVSKEPVIVSVPDTKGRYYLLPMLDMWSDVFAVPGKRTSGTEAGRFAVVGPKWRGKLPKGVTPLAAPTPFVWIIGRTQTNGPKDYDAVHKVQDGYKLTPLSYWGKRPPALQAKIDPAVDMKTPPLIQVRDMSAKDYFSYAARLMALHRPHVTDSSMLMRMKRIELTPGKGFDFESLDAATQEALTEGAKYGLEMMNKLAPSIADVRNGWQMNTETMGVYGNSYLKRAVIAMIGLGANQQQDAIYPLNIADADGKPMMGENKYVLHFDKDELPPVGAFWSVTMYDTEGFQVHNAIERYAIGDRDELKYNADGSLEIYIQHESPGKDKESNWLPAPQKGALGITMRLYAPKLEVLAGQWVPPAVKQIR